MNKVFEPGSVVGWVGRIQCHACLSCPLMVRFLCIDLVVRVSLRPYSIENSVRVGYPTQK